MLLNVLSKVNFTNIVFVFSSNIIVYLKEMVGLLFIIMTFLGGQVLREVGLHHLEDADDAGARAAGLRVGLGHGQ